MSGDSMLTRLRSLGPGARTVNFPKSGARLHAMVTSAGHDHCRDPSYDWHGLNRGAAPYVLLQHTLSGRGHLRIGRNQHVLSAGDTMLLAFPHDHRYWLARGDTWEFFWLCLNGREVLRIWREAMAVAGSVVSLQPSTVDRLIGLTIEVMEGRAPTPARASALAYSAAMEVADEVLPWGMQGNAARPEAVQRALALARARDRQPKAPGRIDVAALTAASGYSRYHFTRLFTQSEGISPARFLLQLRLEEAMAALRTSPVPIKTIAARCGFTDANYFGKVFRRMFGITPSAFRRGAVVTPTNSHRNDS